MAFIPTPNAAKVVISYGPPGINALSNTLWFTKTGFDLADMEALAFDIRSWWFTYVLVALNSNIEFNQIEVIDARTLGAPSFVDVNGAGTPGSVVGTPSDLRMALVVTMRTADRGRFARGRNYIRGFAEANTTAQSIDNVLGGAILAGYSLKLLSDPPVGWTPVIRSTQQAGIIQNPANTRPITAVLVRSYIAGSIRKSYSRP